MVSRPIARVAAATLAVFLWADSASAHDWYSKRRDPVMGWSCCGGHDCARLKVTAQNVTAEKNGIRIRLSLDEAMAINPYASAPVDALVPWARVQESEDGDWHLCISIDRRDPPTGGIYCLFQPGNS